MNWIAKGDQIINLELVSEIYKYFDGKYYIKFKLSDSITSLQFESAKIRDEKFKELKIKLKSQSLDI